jgi:hypothetical protein
MSSLNREQMSRQLAAKQPTEQMSQMIRAYWTSQIVGTFARLGIPDHLASGPLAAGEVAQLIACHPGRGEDNRASGMVATSPSSIAASP